MDRYNEYEVHIAKVHCSRRLRCTLRGILTGGSRARSLRHFAAQAAKSLCPGAGPRSRSALDRSFQCTARVDTTQRCSACVFTVDTYILRLPKLPLLIFETKI